MAVNNGQSQNRTHAVLSQPNNCTICSQCNTNELAVLGQASPSPSPTPAVSASPTPDRPEEQICDYTTYSASYQFEVTEGLDARAQECESNVFALTKLQFGPPTEWEIFTTLCKGDCQAYNDRVSRILTVSDCNCARIADPRFRCPVTPADYLCEIMQICKPYSSYITEYCTPSSCGRFATNEDDWRTARQACSAAYASGSLAAVVLASIATMAQTR